jgi:PelA/Pel-15E family pectate lyase
MASHDSLFKHFILLFCAVASIATCAFADGWDDAQRQPPAWFETADGNRVVNNVLLYQFPSGGWPKNLDMAAPLDGTAKARLADRPDEATIDNGATVTQLRFLARAAAETKDEKIRVAFLRGLDYLLVAQSPSGGWPQTFPNPLGYHAHITFNDNAMASVLTLLRETSPGAPPFDFVDAGRRRRAEAAVTKGIACILKCQIIVDGRLTAWCAQHDETTVKPAAARAFEPVSLSGSESVGLVRFLMGIERPSPDVIVAVRSAVAWLDSVKLTGLRVTAVQTPDGPDRVALEDSAASPLWARFYEIGTNRPIFTGRDGIVHYLYSEIERERRTGYAYYGNWPEELLRREYPAWEEKWGVSADAKSRN